MRIAVGNRPGFSPLPAGKAYAVTVDGRPLGHVVAVDTSAGVAWVHDTLPDGSLRLDPTRTFIVEREVHGVMRIEEIAQ